MADSLKIYYFWRIRHTHWHFWRVGARFKQGKDLEDQLLSELLVNFTLQTITKLKMSWGPGTQSYIHVLVRASYSRHRCYKKKKIKNMVILHLSLLSKTSYELPLGGSEPNNKSSSSSSPLPPTERRSFSMEKASGNLPKKNCIQVLCRMCWSRTCNLGCLGGQA